MKGTPIFHPLKTEKRTWKINEINLETFPLVFKLFFELLLFIMHL
jgi:hypothetical protein